MMMRDEKTGTEASLGELLASGNPYGVVCAGVTGFDAMSDTADDVTEIVSRRIRHSVRNGDIALLVDEGEYLIVIRGSYDIESYQTLQKRIRNVVEQQVIVGGENVMLHVDFGCASYPDDGLTYEEVVEHARGAMLRAQRSRRRYSSMDQEGRLAAGEQDAGQQAGTAQADALTGLPDAFYFRSTATKVVESAGKMAEKIAVVFCDIEKFKEYNLKYGYDSGDDLLKFLADTLEDAFPNDLIARLNSDRFGILTHDEGLEDKLSVVHEKVRMFRISSSIEFKAGICALKDCEFGTTRAQDYARLACDSIKGRYDRFVCRFDDTLASQIQRRQHIVDNLDTAISSGWIEVYYQPIIRGITGKVCGFEALARWNDPTFGMLPPGEFIDVLEDAHLIHKLDVCIVKTVCKDLQMMNERGFTDVSASINLSRLDYELCDIFSVVDGIAESAGIAKSSLHIEFTETAFTQNATFFTNVIEDFREAGYSIWMDDFGSGYSSLNSLKDYSFDVLKIDMAFLHGLEKSSRTRDIVASVVDMAKKLGLQTLAEGVETDVQFDFLRSVGCEMMQGYLFGRPQALDEVLAQVESGIYQLEKRGMFDYYRSIGQVNMLSPSPFTHADDHMQALVFASGIPLAIVEECNGSLSAMTTNPLFVDEVDNSDFAQLDGTTFSFTNQGAKLRDEIMAVGHRAKEQDVVQSFDFYDFTQVYTMRIMFIDSSGDSNAFLVSLDHYSSTAERNHPKPDIPQGDGRMVYLPVPQETAWQQSDELDLAHTAILVIDVNGGTEGITPGLEEMAANSVALVKAARKANMPVIFNCDSHIPGLDRELELWGNHGIRGAQSGTPISEFDVCDTDIFVPKRRYNGFFETDLELTLRELEVTTLIAVGCDTNICVSQTLAGAYFYGFKSVVPSDATGTFLIGTQEYGLEYLSRLYDSRIVTTADILERINAYAAQRASGQQPE